MSSRTRATRPTRRRRPAQAEKKKSQVVTPRGPFNLNASAPRESGQFAPPVAKTTLRWSNSSIAATSATYQEFILQGNSLFDPGLSTSSSQPIGYDQFAIWYEVYRVLASRLTLKTELVEDTVGTPSTYRTVGARIVAYYSNVATAAANVNDAMAHPGARACFISASKTGAISMKEMTSKVMGVNPAGIADGSQAGVGQNPSELWYWHIGYVSPIAYANTSITFQFTLDFDAVFYIRSNVPLSLFHSEMARVRKALDAEKKRIASIEHVNKFDEKTTGDAPLNDIEEMPTRSASLRSQCGLNPLAAEFKTPRTDPLPVKNRSVDALLEEARAAQRRHAAALLTANGTNPTNRRWIMVEPTDSKLGDSVIMDSITPNRPAPLASPSLPTNGKA